jgi:hypothetical protein
MWRVTSHTNRRTSVISSRRGQEGGAILVILIVVAVIAFLAFTVSFVGKLVITAPPKPSTFAVYNGSLTAPKPFPTLVNSNVSATYTVTTHNVTVPNGMGPAATPISTTKPVGVQNAIVMFNLTTGDATFSDGSTSKSVKTDKNGLATVTIKPAKDGVDGLTLVMSIETGWFWKKWHIIPDANSYQFEVDKP